MGVKSSLFVVAVEIMNGLILAIHQASFHINRSDYFAYRPIRSWVFENGIKISMDIKQLIVIINMQSVIKILSKEML